MKVRRWINWITLSIINKHRRKAVFINSVGNTGFEPVTFAV
jgi:hypothetical protein